MSNQPVLRKSILLFSILLCVAVITQNIHHSEAKSNEGINSKESQTAWQRSRRATRKPGFFKTLFQVIYEQYNETRHTINSVSKMINENIAPDNQPVTKPTTISNDPNASTTTEAYKITRAELNKIIQRNVKGLIRLYNIELKDALKQSDQNYIEFKKNASKEVSKYL